MIFEKKKLFNLMQNKTLLNKEKQHLNESFVWMYYILLLPLYVHRILKK